MADQSVSPFCSSKSPKMIIAGFLIVLTIILNASSGSLACGFTSIINFGDSLADTGNDRYTVGGIALELPYGKTYFHHPTGRFSNGRLIIDFIAQSLGLPLLLPSLGGGDFKHGVNFAVSGATALKLNHYSNYSLDLQLEWFQKLLPSLCKSFSDCNKFFRKSLFVLGEFGANDYNDPLFRRASIETVLPLVPKVINKISSAVKTLINLGAVNIVVPGNLPSGCSVVFLNMFESPHKDDYDPQTGCLNWLNEFTEYHNSLLKKELQRLQTLYPNTTIVYADYYNASMVFYRSPTTYGFNGLIREACCGNGVDQTCGYPGVSVCEDPSSFMSWDGLHLTEAVNRWIVMGFVEGSYIVPPRINMSCVSQDISVNPLAII